MMNPAPCPRPAQTRARLWKTACLLTWVSLLVVLTFELWPRFQGAWSKTPWGRVQPWQAGIAAFIEPASDVARRDLFHPAPRLKLDPRRMDRSRTLLWIRDRISGGIETRNSWPNALLVQACIESGSVADADLERYWDELIDADGEWLEPPVLLSHCLVGMPLLDWHERTARDRYRVAAQHLVEWLVKSHPRSLTGTLPYRPEEPNVLLVDSLGMICPLLARYGRTHNQPEAIRLAKQQLLEFLERGMDDRSGLPFHAYRVDDLSRQAAFGLAGWGRGAGWLALGLAGTLPWLADDDLDRPRIEQALRDLLETAQDLQRDDGLWGWALNIPGAEPDTSATGMLAWATRLGVESGIQLNPEVEASRRRAVRGILRHTRSSGEVGQSMADAAGVGQYPWLFGHTTWTQAFALLSAAGLDDR